MVANDPDQQLRREVGLPPRPFLYTLDQVGTLLDVELARVRDRYTFYSGRSTGRRPRDRVLARNIAPDGERPDWRVSEHELLRFLRYHGFRSVNRTFTK